MAIRADAPTWAQEPSIDVLAVTMQLPVGPTARKIAKFGAWEINWHGPSADQETDLLDLVFAEILKSRPIMTLEGLESLIESKVRPTGTVKNLSAALNLLVAIAKP